MVCKFLGFVKRKEVKKEKTKRISYKNYLISDWWKKRRKSFFLKNRGICFVCGKKAELMNVHHKNYARKWKEEDKDLVLLCRDCHLNAHKVIKEGKCKLKNAHNILKAENQKKKKEIDYIFNQLFNKQNIFD